MLEISLQSSSDHTNPIPRQFMCSCTAMPHVLGALALLVPGQILPINLTVFCGMKLLFQLHLQSILARYSSHVSSPGVSSTVRVT